jgi:GntR family transcriptional regulator
MYSYIIYCDGLFLMQIRISPHDGVPIYQQIVNQVKYLVASGRLVADDEVPAIRRLAEQLLVNPNTVARAYRELEAAGVLVSKQGSGTRVSGNGSPYSKEEIDRILSERADALLVEAEQLGVGLDDVVRLLKLRKSAFDTNEKEGG